MSDHYLDMIAPATPAKRLVWKAFCKATRGIDRWCWSDGRTIVGRIQRTEAERQRAGR